MELNDFSDKDYPKNCLNLLKETNELLSLFS